MPKTLDDLNRAIVEGDLEEITTCLDAEVDPNELDSDGFLPLESISGPSAEEITRKLFDYGADPLLKNQKGKYPFGKVLKGKNSTIVTLFLTEIKRKQDERKQELTDVTFTQSGDEIPLLFYVIKYGNVRAVNSFIKILGKRPDLTKRYKDKTALIFSLDLKKYEIANCLFDNGASPEEKNNENSTVLHYFSRAKDSKYAKEFLKKYNPSTNATNNKQESCLHVIARNGRYKTLDVVLDEKCNVNQQNSFGNTPLIIALKKILASQKELKKRNEGFYDSEYDSDEGQELEEGDAEHEKYCWVVRKLLSNGCLVNINDKAAVGLSKKLYNDTYTYNLKNQIHTHSQIEDYHNELKNILKSLQIDNPILYKKCNFIANFIKLKYEENIEDKTDISKEIELANNLLKNIELENILNHNLVRLYEIIKALITDNYPATELVISDRLNAKYLPKPIEKNQYYYTFLDEKLYRLTSNNKKEHIIYELMTTLVYEARRNLWDSDICRLHHRLICKLDKKYENYDLKRYSSEIFKAESKEHTYFGENISDDSDAPEEDAYKILTHRKKSLTQNYSQNLFERSQSSALFQKKDPSKFSKCGEDKSPFDLYDRAKRQHIYRSDPVSDHVQRDLERLNMLAIKGKLDDESIESIATSFYVAQYRGIGYRLNDGKSKRKLHRKLREESQPQFSRAVLAEAGYLSFYDYIEKKDKDSKRSNELAVGLLGIAENLQDQLIQLASSGPVTVDFIGDAYQFDNALQALQDFYTKSYDKFLSILKEFVEKFTKPISEHDQPPKIDSITALKDAIVYSIDAQYNPIVSTSDTPEHALRYAYNDKFYEGHKDERLRPRWRRDGQCERPYSGKIYISLHSPLELYKKSHHLPSLNAQTQTHVISNIIAERETSFFAYMPAERIVSQHIAKFPSFKGDYKEIYLEKYGLTKDLYKKFQDKILSSKPHSKERKKVTRYLTAHLVSYQEVSLIEEAQIAARNKDPDAILIYRNQYGGFSLHPCQTHYSTHVLDEKKARAADSIIKKINEERDERKGISIINEGFLTNILKKYYIYPARKETESLISSLALLLDQPVGEIEKIQAQIKTSTLSIAFFHREKTDLIKRSFGKWHSLLKAVAGCYNVIIHLHCPELAKEYQTINISKQAKIEIHLYYCGGQKFAALWPKELPLPKRFSEILTASAESVATSGDLQKPSDSKLESKDNREQIELLPMDQSEDQESADKPIVQLSSRKRKVPSPTFFDENTEKAAKKTKTDSGEREIQSQSAVKLLEKKEISIPFGNNKGNSSIVSMDISDLESAGIESSKINLNEAVKHFMGQESKDNKSQNLCDFKNWYSDRAIIDVIFSKLSTSVLRCVFLPFAPETVVDNSFEDVSMESKEPHDNSEEKPGKPEKIDDADLELKQFDEGSWEPDVLEGISKEPLNISKPKKDIKVITSTFEKQFASLQILKSTLQAKYACFILFEPDDMSSNKHFIFAIYIKSYLLIIDPMGKAPRDFFLEKINKIKKTHKIDKVFFSQTKIQNDPEGDVSCGPICTELMLYLSNLDENIIFAVLNSISTRKSEKIFSDGNKIDYHLIELLDTELLPKQFNKLNGYKNEQYVSFICFMRKSHLDCLYTSTGSDRSKYEQYIFTHLVQDKISISTLEQDSRCKELVDRYKPKIKKSSNASFNDTQHTSQQRLLSISDTYSMVGGERVVHKTSAAYLSDDPGKPGLGL